MEWCQAMGKAHQIRAPRMDWPSVSGRMLRWRANNRHIPKPPIKVTGTRTGFGQWRAAKLRLESAAAIVGCSMGFEIQDPGSDAELGAPSEPPRADLRDGVDVANRKRFIR